MNPYLFALKHGYSFTQVESLHVFRIKKNIYYVVFSQIVWVDAYIAKVFFYGIALGRLNFWYFKSG